MKTLWTNIIDSFNVETRNFIGISDIIEVFLDISIPLFCYNNCRIKTSHSNRCSRGKIPCQRPNPRAKTWDKIWMTSLNPNYDTIPISFPQNAQKSAKNPRLLTIPGAIWFCRSSQCTHSPLWMHRPVAKECRLITSQYPIVDRFICSYTLLLVSRPTPLIESASVRYEFTLFKTVFTE